MSTVATLETSTCGERFDKTVTHNAGAEESNHNHREAGMKKLLYAACIGGKSIPWEAHLYGDEKNTALESNHNQPPRGQYEDH